MGICRCLERPENVWENNCSLGNLGKIPAGAERKKHQEAFIRQICRCTFSSYINFVFSCLFQSKSCTARLQKGRFFSDASVEQVIWKSKPPSADYRNLCNTVPNCAVPFESKRRHIHIKYLWSRCTLLP